MRLNTKIIIVITLLLSSLFLIVSCNNKEVNLKTSVENTIQIDVNYPKGTLIEEPKYILTNNNKVFKAWHINGVIVSFPYKLEKDTVLTALLENKGGNIGPIQPNPGVQPEPQPNPQPNPGQPSEPITDDSKPTYTGSYYDKIDFNADEKTLFLQLSELISNFKDIGYNAVRTEMIHSEVDPKNPSKLWGIYDSRPLDKNETSNNVWNREHVWPQSKLNGVTKSDYHNLRASDTKTNSDRGNRDFLDASGNYQYVGSGYYPGDEHKGDVARILLFMATCHKDRLKLTRLSNNTHHSYSDTSDLHRSAKKKKRPKPNQPNKPSNPKSSGKGRMGDLSVLYKWHLEDPVSEFEINRNNHIFKCQGNRNPFIDHPECFKKVWEYLVSIDN